MTPQILLERSKDRLTNEALAKQVLEELIAQGIFEFCVCAGSRNAPLIYPLIYSNQVKLYHWPEERSAAFFALGRIKATGRPVAVISTSGSAAAEFLPATMEAFYTGLPLILLTSDRPRRFRKSGAPQSVEQVGLYTDYIHEMQDLESGEECHLNKWSRRGPLHLNLCFEEPQDSDCSGIRLNEVSILDSSLSPLNFLPDQSFIDFIHRVRCPLVIVGALSSFHHEVVIRFLLHLKAPVYLEASSGIREESRLAFLRITQIESIWNFSEKHGYPINGILRVGGVPTARLWRDLEKKCEQKENPLTVFSVSEQPFSGLSCAGVTHTSLISFLNWAQTLPRPTLYDYTDWKRADDFLRREVQSLFFEEPRAEASLIHRLSIKIPKRSKIFLGNSLPIREWDQAATDENRYYQIASSRGVNGIDGQMSTFLGFCSPEQENWSILGDLTTLYDLVAPWIMSQLRQIHATVVIVNNGGGRIFSRMFEDSTFQNVHQLSFEPLAKLWNWNYEKWEAIPHTIAPFDGARFIELIPDEQATKRFLKSVTELQKC